MGMLETTRRGFDRHYIGVSPQLLARVRQSWIAQRLDLDGALARRRSRPCPATPRSTRCRCSPTAGQSTCCCCSTRPAAGSTRVRAAAAMMRRPREGKLSPDQARGLVAVTSRLRDELAAVRTLAIAGLAMPAMQISRAISEDVDLALAMMVRRRARPGLRRMPHAGGRRRVLAQSRRRRPRLPAGGAGALPLRTRLLRGQRIRALAQGGARLPRQRRAHLLRRRRSRTRPRSPPDR